MFDYLVDAADILDQLRLHKQADSLDRFMKLAGQRERAVDILALEENIEELEGIMEGQPPERVEYMERQKDSYLQQLEVLWDRYHRMAGTEGYSRGPKDVEIAKRVFDILSRRRPELEKTREERLKSRIERGRGELQRE